MIAWVNFRDLGTWGASTPLLSAAARTGRAWTLLKVLLLAFPALGLIIGATYFYGSLHDTYGNWSVFEGLMIGTIYVTLSTIAVVASRRGASRVRRGAVSA